MYEHKHTLITKLTDLVLVSVKSNKQQPRHDIIAALAV
jgi:hypothetical protein